MTYHSPVNGMWGPWSDYDTCSATCGTGQRTRTRQCNNPAPSQWGDPCAGDNTQVKDCNTQACPGIN